MIAQSHLNYLLLVISFLGIQTDPGRTMTFLDFPESSTTKTDKLLKSAVENEKSPTKQPAAQILSRVPPKIEPIRSEVLSRAAAFLPQLAASNRAILQRNPEEINIEMLKGDETEVIEMKLGLGVFEEKKKKSSESDESSSDSDSSSEDSEEMTEDKTGKRKIIVLPSEIRAAAQSESNRIDPFERVINSLLLFDGSTDEGEAEEVEEQSADDEDEDEDMEVLDFE